MQKIIIIPENPNSELRIPVDPTRIPNPESLLILPEPRTPNPEPRIPNPESRIPNPERENPEPLFFLFIPNPELGDISSYHEQQLKSILFQIKQDLTDASATLDATNTALNYRSADYERKQAKISQRAEQKADEHAAQKAKADERTQDYLAILGVALTVAQLVTDLHFGWQLLLILGSGILTRYLIHRMRKTE